MGSAYQQKISLISACLLLTSNASGMQNLVRTNGAHEQLNFAQRMEQSAARILPMHRYILGTFCLLYLFGLIKPYLHARARTRILVHDYALPVQQYFMRKKYESACKNHAETMHTLHTIFWKKPTGQPGALRDVVPHTVEALLGKPTLALDELEKAWNDPQRWHDEQAGDAAFRIHAPRHLTTAIQLLWYAFAVRTAISGVAFVCSPRTQNTTTDHESTEEGVSDPDSDPSDAPDDRKDAPFLALAHFAYVYWLLIRSLHVTFD